MEVVLYRLLRVLPDLLVFIVSVLGQTAAWCGCCGWKARGRRTADAAGHRGRCRIVDGGVADRFPAALSARVALFSRLVVELGNRTFDRLGVALAVLAGRVRGASRLRRVSCLGHRAGHSPARRRFFQTAYAAVFAAPPAVLGYGVFIERHQLFLREHKLQIPDLPRDLDGLRLVQLTDIHLSPFLSRAELERASIWPMKHAPTLRW